MSEFLNDRPLEGDPPYEGVFDNELTFEDLPKEKQDEIIRPHLTDGKGLVVSKREADEQANAQMERAWEAQAKVAEILRGALDTGDHNIFETDKYLDAVRELEDANSANAGNQQFRVNRMGGPVEYYD